MKRILIASVLKPVNDARMYEKIGTSLSRLPDYEIHIAGFSGSIPDDDKVRFYPLFNFSRLSISRFLSPWKFYKLAIKVKPQYIISTTHELLIVSCIYKILFGCKIIYDVQENYFRNIAYTSTFPPFLRMVLAAGVRAKEILTRPLIDHYFLAEKNYEKEFSFTKEKSTILENKTLRKSVSLINPDPKNKGFRLLYSGTIAESYGVFEAVKLAISLHSLEPEISLTIIGYCAKKQTLTELEQAIKPHPFIRLIGGNKLVPHRDILQEIARSDFGLVSYRPNKSTINCIPTKLYEYLAFRLPMIIQTNPVWMEFAVQYNAGVGIDYMSPDPQILLQILRNHPFYTGAIPQNIYWEEEEPKLFNALKPIS